MQAFLHLLVILAAAACMFVPAVRHPEWRGGLMALGFVFLAAAADECESLWGGIFRDFVHEPELIPILLALAAAVVCAVVWRGTFLTTASAVSRNRRFPILVWGLLFVSLLPNAAKAKGIWALCAPGVAATHGVRELAEDTTRLFGHVLLLNWAVLFLKDKWRIFGPRTSRLNRLVFEHPLEEVGRGTRRVAYRIGETGYCVKFYYPQEQCVEALKMQKSIQRDVKWRRFNKARNSSSAEVHVYKLFRHTMPADIRRAMPPVCERVYHPIWGWGILETYYTNPDGTAIIPYEFEIARSTPADRERIYALAVDLLERVARAGALFYEPGNFHVLRHPDGSLELKIIDFEPESKSAIPIERFSRALRSRKLRRKAKRYLARLRRKYGIRHVTLDQLAAEAACGVRFTSFKSVIFGNMSRNYCASLADGTVHFIKIGKPAAVEQQLEWAREMATDLIPRTEFSGHTGVFGKLRICAFEWRAGEMCHPADLDAARCRGLVRDYLRFSDALQRVSRPPCHAPFPPAAYAAAAPRMLHGDLHFRNLFFTGDSVKTFLDLEKMRLGNPAEDLLRLFVHAMERTRFFARARHAAMRRNFATVVRESPWSCDVWCEAISLYGQRKAQRRERKSRFPVFKRIERFLRAPLYRQLERIVRQVKEDAA